MARLPAKLLPEHDGAAYHNAYYLPVSLGDEFTDAQKQAIKSGTFNGLHVGSFWEYGGYKFEIAGCNYFLNTGDSVIDKNHIVVIPNMSIAEGAMINDNSGTSKRYVVTSMFTDTLTRDYAYDDPLCLFNDLFGNDFIYEHRENLPASQTKLWATTKLNLLSEPMVCGHYVNNGEAQKDMVALTQLPLFRFKSPIQDEHESIWLRDWARIESSAGNFFSIIDEYGRFNTALSMTSHGVRPYALITGE